MVKTSAYLVLAVMLLGVVPVVMAEDVPVTSAVTATGAGAAASSAVAAAGETAVAGHYERCLRVMDEEYPEADEARVQNFCRTKTLARNECVKRMRQAFPDGTNADAVRTCNQLTTAVAAEVIERNAPGLSDEQRLRLQKLEAVEARKIAANHPVIAAKVAQFTDAEVEKLGKLDRARLSELSGLSPAQIRSELGKLTVARVKQEDAFRKRVVAEHRLRMAEANYEQAVQDYERAKSGFDERKSAWEVAVGAGDEQAAIAHAKAYLGHAADMVIEALEKVKAKVEGNDDLSEEEAADAIADLDAKIAEMESLKARLEAAQTKEEVKAAGKGILAAWERTRNRLQVHAEHVVRTQVGEILGRSEALERHLDRVLAEMEEQGVDVSAYDDQLDLFSEKVADAREKFKESKGLFEQAKDDGDRDALQRSRELSREAHQLLKEAHQVLMGLVRDVRQAGYEVEDDDEYVEVVEEDDDDSSDDVDDEDEPVACCQALIASCLACQAGEDIEDYCEDNPEVTGCEAYAADEGNQTTNASAST